MPRYRIFVSYSTTTEHSAVVEVEAEDIDSAEEQALDIAEDGKLEWDESEIDKTQYEAAEYAG